jgi:hypothetical protein
MPVRSREETASEKRARQIFEAEGRRGVAWTLAAPQDRKPSEVTPIVLSEAAKERYRRLARKELGL